AAIVSKLQGRFGSGAQPVPQN
ncbi:unnamed protein product, partial [Adineta steineri]